MTKIVLFRKYTSTYAFVKVDVPDDATDEQTKAQAWKRFKDEDVFHSWPVEHGPCKMEDGRIVPCEESWQLSTAITTFDDDLFAECLGALDEREMAEYEAGMNAVRSAMVTQRG